MISIYELYKNEHFNIYMNLYYVTETHAMSQS